MDGGQAAWRSFPDNCPWCGAGAEVFTISTKPDWVYEDEAARCEKCNCPGAVHVDEYRAWIEWHDEPDCACEWCRAHFNSDGGYLGGV